MSLFLYFYDKKFYNIHYIMLIYLYLYGFMSLDLPVLDISCKWNYSVMWPFVSSFFSLMSDWRFIMISRLEHKLVLHSFLWLKNILLYGYTTFCLYTHLDRDLGDFQFLTVTNNACISTHEWVFVQTYVFSSLRYMPGSGIAGSYGYSMFKFLQNSQTVF